MNLNRTTLLHGSLAFVCGLAFSYVYYRTGLWLVDHGIEWSSIDDFKTAKYFVTNQSALAAVVWFAVALRLTGIPFYRRPGRFFYTTALALPAGLFFLGGLDGSVLSFPFTLISLVVVGLGFVLLWFTYHGGSARKPGAFSTTPSE